jgi:hypothetical protein
MGRPGKTQHAIRRSTRLPLEVPVRLTSLDAAVAFSEECNTTLVNAHGCGLIANRAIAQGTRVRIEIVSATRHATARVAEVVPLGGEPETWLIGLELEAPGNFWGIQYAPSDWKIESSTSAEVERPTNHDSIAAAKQVPPRRWRLTDISAGACYLESTLPFPADAAVLMSIRASDRECLLEGIVRVSHEGTGMGVEFTHAQGDLVSRVNELISRLTSSREVPRIFVGRKEGQHVAGEPLRDDAQEGKPDPLRQLIRGGSSLTVEQFMNKLRTQRIDKQREARNDLASTVLLPGQP